MRKITTMALFMLLTLSMMAQKNKNKNPNLPAFGDVSKEDLELKECDFDPNAEAMILLEDGNIEYILGKGGELHHRVRIKILNEKGRAWADVHLTYFSERRAQDISGLDAQTYNLDANGNVVVTKLDKKLVYEKKLNKRFSQKVFTFPEVKVGSIIEYRYKHIGLDLMDWHFQRSIPVRYSHFKIDFPEEIEIAAIPYCNRQYEAKSESSGMRYSKEYSMSQIPGLRNEPYVINEDYYRDKLQTKVVAFNINGKRENRVLNWLQVIRALMEDEDFGVQVKRNIPRTADLDARLATLSAPYEKMKCIYQYVQQNMEWNEYTGIWAFDGVRSAWKDKKGTVGEINLILVNLLKDAGIDAHPILVSTHNNGIVNSADAGTYGNPGTNQFDKVMAYVVLDGQVYVLDASQKDVPAHLIPKDVVLTEGLLIEKIETMQWGWKTLWRNDLVSKNIYMIKAGIQADGKMKGQVDISSYDYARLGRAAAAKKGKEKFMEQFIPKNTNGLTVEDVKFENLDSDSLPLVQKISFEQNLNTAGEYQYFSTNILSSLESNPFVSDSRISDIFFGTNQSHAIYGYFTAPEGYEFDELPKNLKLIMPDTSIVISRISQVTGNTLQTRVMIDFKRPIYTASQYVDLQEFFRRLYDILNEQYVIRKKSAQP